MTGMADTTATIARIRGFLENQGIEAAPTDDGFEIPYESTVVIVSVTDAGEATIVSLYSPVLIDVTPTPALYKWIATDGGQFIFGHAVIEEPEEGGHLLSFDHRLFGETLDEREFIEVVAVLATASDELSEDLQEQFGGKRLVEVAEDAVEAPEQSPGSPIIFPVDGITDVRGMPGLN